MRCQKFARSMQCLLRNKKPTLDSNDVKFSRTTSAPGELWNSLIYLVHFLTYSKWQQKFLALTITRFLRKSAPEVIPPCTKHLRRYRHTYICGDSHEVAFLDSLSLECWLVAKELGVFEITSSSGFFFGFMYSSYWNLKFLSSQNFEFSSSHNLKFSSSWIFPFSTYWIFELSDFRIFEFSIVQIIDIPNFQAFEF